MLTIVLIQMDWIIEEIPKYEFSTVFPYKCIGPIQMHGKQIWPCRKKVKCQCRTIILAILVDLLSPRICAKIRPQGLFGYLEKKIFKGFYHIWACPPSWSMDRDHFSTFLFSQPKEAPHEFEQHWPRGFRGEVVWNFQYFSHTNVWCPYKCIRKQTWPRREKIKRQCMTIILATFVELPSLIICAKIQPQSILCSGEEEF